MNVRLWLYLFCAITRGYLESNIIGISSLALLLVACSPLASAASGRLELDAKIDLLEAHFSTRLDDWLAHLGDQALAESTEFDDSTWDKADVGYRWKTPNSICWFRR